MKYLYCINFSWKLFASNSFGIYTLVERQKKENRDDGLHIPLYKIYNIGNNHPENLLDFDKFFSKNLSYSMFFQKFSILKHT